MKLIDWLKCLPAVLLALSAGVSAQAQTSTFTDARDGRVYREVKIGARVWMAENLNYEADSSWCYEDSPDSCAKYGRLYAFGAAVKACPAGWRLPDTARWNELERTAGGWKVAGKNLKAKSGWQHGGQDKGTDKFGFSALPGSVRDDEGAFGDARGGVGSMTTGYLGKWWSATEAADYDTYAHSRYMYHHNEIIADLNPRTYGLSVRCVRDAAGGKGRK